MNKNPGRWIALLGIVAALASPVAAAAPAGLRDGLSAFLRGQYEQAAALLEAALASGDWANAAERNSALRTLATAETLAGRYAKAEAAVAELLILTASAGPATAVEASDLMLAGRIAKEQGRYAAAEKAYREAIERLSRHYGMDHPEIAEALRQLGDISYALGEVQAAERLYWRSYMVGSYVAGADSSLVGRALLGLGLVRQAQKRPGEGRELLVRALQIADKPARSDAKWDRLDARDLRALHAEEREYVAFRGKIYARASEPSHPDFAEHLEHRGRILRALERLDEADAAFRRALDIRRKNFSDGHPMTAYDLRQLAEIGAARGAAR